MKMMVKMMKMSKVCLTVNSSSSNMHRHHH